MAYKRKTADEYRIFGDYGQGWEEVTAETTRTQAKARLKEYRENESYPFKLTGPHRVPLA